LRKLLHMTVRDYPSSNAIYFEFDQLVHKAKSDHWVYKRNWHETGFQPGTTELGGIVATALMQDGTGVEKTEMRSYVIHVVDISGAVSTGFIIEAIKNALRKRGYTLIEQPREAGSPYLGLRVSKLDSPRLAAIVLWHSTVRATRELVRSIVLSLKRAPRAIGRHLPGSVRNFLQI